MTNPEILLTAAVFTLTMWQFILSRQIKSDEILRDSRREIDKERVKHLEDRHWTLDEKVDRIIDALGLVETKPEPRKFIQKQEATK